MSSQRYYDRQESGGKWVRIILEEDGTERPATPNDPAWRSPADTIHLDLPMDEDGRSKSPVERSLARLDETARRADDCLQWLGELSVSFDPPQEKHQAFDGLAEHDWKGISHLRDEIQRWINAGPLLKVLSQDNPVERLGISSTSAHDLVRALVCKAIVRVCEVVRPGIASGFSPYWGRTTLPDLDADELEQADWNAVSAAIRLVPLSADEPGPLTDKDFGWLCTALEQEYIRAERALKQQSLETPEPNTGRKGKKAAITWQAVASRLEQLRLQGKAFESQPTYSVTLSCSPATINKAIKNTPSLRDWAARPTSSTSSAIGIHGVPLDSTPQQREPNPADALEPADVDAAMRYLMEQATPQERAQINAMPPDARRQLAEIAYRDPDRTDKILEKDRSPHSQ